MLFVNKCFCRRPITAGVMLLPLLAAPLPPPPLLPPLPLLGVLGRDAPPGCLAGVCR